MGEPSTAERLPWHIKCAEKSNILDSPQGHGKK